MSDLEHNQRNRALARRARILADKLDEIAELQDDVKQIRAESKKDGYSVKALNKTANELRRTAQYMADQLELEAELTTYRVACGLPVTLEDAQKRAKEAAEQAPDVDAKKAAREKRRINEPLN